MRRAPPGPSLFHCLIMYGRHYQISSWLTSYMTRHFKMSSSFIKHFFSFFPCHWNCYFTRDPCCFLDLTQWIIICWSTHPYVFLLHVLFDWANKKNESENRRVVYTEKSLKSRLQAPAPATAPSQDPEDHCKCAGSGNRRHSFQAECCCFPKVCDSWYLNWGGDGEVPV